MLYMDPSLIYSQMDQFDPYADIPQTQTQTQPATQSTQAGSQDPDRSERDQLLWGRLIPCKSGLDEIELFKTKLSVTFGRNNTNDVTFRRESTRISGKHCTITWDGVQNLNSTLIVHDHSSNGTFINGIKVGRGMTRVLRDGNEIALGSWAAQSTHEDHRYIFRFVAGGPPTEGFFVDYEIICELGKGTFATVMKTLHRPSGGLFAVKIIYRARFMTRESEHDKMFLREIQILKTLHHPNICTLKQVFDGKDTICLVLEYVSGGDLLTYILNRGSLSEQATVNIILQLCDALAYMHSKGIAHRDLKPENILMMEDDPPTIKVADFGLAKAVDSMTMFKTTCGTPSYLAPEVILRRPEEGYDNLVDSFSVGVIVYAMLTGASAFLEENENVDVKTKFENRRVDWHTLRSFEPSENAVDFIARLLEEDPRQRMSLTDALEHPWLSPLKPFRSFNRAPRNFPATNFVSEKPVLTPVPESPVPGSSMLEPINLQGSADHSFFGGLGQQQDPADQSNYAIGQDFEDRLNLESRSGSLSVPQAYLDALASYSQPINPSQSRSQFTQSQGGTKKPLQRRVIEINELDPEGELMTWEMVPNPAGPIQPPELGDQPSADLMPPPAPKPSPLRLPTDQLILATPDAENHANGHGNNDPGPSAGKKRKVGEAMSSMEDIDSPLTPIGYQGMEEDPSSEESNGAERRGEGRMTRASNGNNKKVRASTSPDGNGGRGAAGNGKSKASPINIGAGAADGYGRRTTRATARRAAMQQDEEDDAMDVEEDSHVPGNSSNNPGRPIRQYPRKKQ